MRKNLKILMWSGLGLVVVSFLTQYAQLIPQPTVGANDLYWAFMGSLNLVSYAGNMIGAILFAGALLIHVGLDRRGADPVRRAQRTEADLLEPEVGGAA